MPSVDITVPQDPERRAHGLEDAAAKDTAAADDDAREGPALTEAHSVTGAVVWDSSVVLAHYLIGNVPWKAEGDGSVTTPDTGIPAVDHAVSWHCSALELGSGCGLLGIALAASGCRVVLSDLPALHRQLTSAAEANRSAVESAGGSVSVVPHVWGDTGALPAELASRVPFDCVVAADTLYDTALVEPFVRSLEAMSSRDTRIWIAFDQVIDRKGAYDAFFEAIAGRFEWKEAPRIHGAAADGMKDALEIKSSVRVLLLRKTAGAK